MALWERGEEGWGGESTRRERESGGVGVGRGSQVGIRAWIPSEKRRELYTDETYAKPGRSKGRRWRVNVLGAGKVGDEKLVAGGLKETERAGGRGVSER